MVSIKQAENVETRHFMDDEHQITIGVDKNMWQILQLVANYNTKIGSDWHNLNVWIINRLLSKPKDIEPWEWISKAVIDLR